ncbi:zinc-binding dehydrogenase [Collinsella sp. AGMB00827]|uniref:Zinc-binding dehydrogenase n=1 Tax=Collinsella ureilytica TaxID=2869515 RepID=A0ABS7MM63_9ACTN|nr:zinc-binding dehydrogenase [Collinsella urealyticum]MBY4798377.1 zinc-binding dehydrogenase [Collinsella urealyticum]
MKTLLMYEPGHVELTDLPTPEPAASEVLIKIVASGICTNDVRDYLGDCNYSYPRIGGHEFAGVIERIGSAVDPKRFRPGQSVVKYIIEDCKVCHYCRTGHENICEEHPRSKIFHATDGISGYCGFAEYVLAQADDIMVFEHERSFAKMAMTEPVACCINSIEQTNVKFGQDVVVIGGGTMGLLHVMLLVRRGARVIVSEPQPARRELARKFGAAAAFDPTACDAVARVRELTDGRGADAVYNTAAHPAVAAQAVKMCAPCGTCVMFSSIHPREDVPIDASALHSFQITVTGAVSPTISAYYEAVQVIDKGIIDPSPLIDSTFKPTEFDQAIARAQEPDSYKVILAFGDEEARS